MYARKKSAGLLTGTGMFEQITQQVCLIQYTFFFLKAKTKKEKKEAYEKIKKRHRIL